VTPGRSGFLFDLLSIGDGPTDFALLWAARDRVVTDLQVEPEGGNVAVETSATLQQKINALETEVASVRTLLEELRQRDLRRTKFRNRERSFVAFLLCCGASGGALLHASDNKPVSTPTVASSTVALPPLDSQVTWSRRDAIGMPTNYTSEILSMVGEGTQTNSFLWPLYIELRGTSSKSATRETSQSVGATVRTLVRSIGSPWTAGFHSELAHGSDALEGGNVIPTNGTSILMNGEMRSYSSGGTTIGVNLQCVYTDSRSKNCDDAINIQAGSATTVWHNGIHFDSNGNYVTGNIGIDFDRSHYNMGLDLANNSIRLNANQKVVLEKSGGAYLWYNSSSGRIEIVRGGSVVASF
jgi:hypothetical protein